MSLGQRGVGVFLKNISLLQFFFFLSITGNSPANIVDSNMSVLRERIKEVGKKEWLEYENGWNYKSVGYEYDYNKHKRHAMVVESLKLFGLVTSAFGLVFLSGSLCIFLVSFVVHLQK